MAAAPAWAMMSTTTVGMGMRRAVAALRARKIDPRTLLRRAGLPRADLSDPAQRVPAEREAAFIEMAAEAANEPLFGLRLAEEAETRQTGLIYYVADCAPTVREGIANYGRYIRILNASFDLRVQLPESGDGTVEMRYLGVPRGHLRHTVEYHLGTIVKYLRDMAGQKVNPSCVTFRHGRTTEIEDFERYFRCPVLFDGDVDRIDYDRATLDIVAPGANPGLLAILRGYAEEAAGQRSAAEGSIRDAVENELHRLLPKGRGAIEAVASALGVGTRSLARRLSEEGTTFSDVLDGLRRSLAVQYLRDSQFTLDEVAWLLGYGEIGAFNSAFRRWSGVAPSFARDNPERLQALSDPVRAASLPE
jgi:AraC-like DNA-binding protein